MIRQIQLILLLLCISGPAALAGSSAVIEAELDPAGEVWVGQRVKLTVTVLVPGWFKQSPRFTLPEVPGLLIFDPGDRPVNTSRTVSGQSMSGTISEFAVIPQRAGEFEIPSIGARFSAAGPLGAEGREEYGQTGPLVLKAVFPPGADGLTSLISAREVSVTQTWEPDRDSGTAGEAISRRVVFTADGVPGMAFPPVDFGRIEGVSVYADSPRVEDERERGAFRGRRIERATYVWQRDGVFELPTLVFFWWNIGEERLVRVELPGREVKVAPGPGVADGPADADRIGDDGLIVWVGLIVALASALVFLLVRHGRSGAAAEADLYHELAGACKAGDPVETDRLLLCWLQVVRPGPEIRTLASLSAETRESGFPDEIAALQRSLLGEQKGWSGQQLAGMLPGMRRELQTRSDHRNGPALPPLNPGQRA